MESSVTSMGSSSMVPGRWRDCSFWTAAFPFDMERDPRRTW